MSKLVLIKVWADAMADPVEAKYKEKMPVSPELFTFVGNAMMAAKAKG